MVKRVREAEILDEDGGSPSEIACSLRSLRIINLLFGGNRMHARLLRRAAAHVDPQRQLHLLEVASGRADVLQAAVRELAWQHRCRITLLDRSVQHLPSSADWSPELPAAERITGDALAIPLPDHSVDIVACCLFLHHLDEEQTRVFLMEALRVARIAVVVNDLERSRLHYLLARLASLVDPSRISRHDGPVSVRQAYTADELRRLLRHTGCKFELPRGFLFRIGAVVWKGATLRAA
jgi:ubiquinone/menaquinone biosynthesis C-methylase UbiE